VAVLGGEVLGSCEISSPGATFDFSTKYEGGARYHLPPRLSATRVANLEAMALTAYRALGCKGAARIDFICPDVGNEVLLEVNTLPGMTPTSLLPKIAKARGLSFEDLCEKLLALAELEHVEVRPMPTLAPRVGAELHAG
jgi:D-alanine-D-alanine ligase